VQLRRVIILSFLLYIAIACSEEYHSESDWCIFEDNKSQDISQCTEETTE